MSTNAEAQPDASTRDEWLRTFIVLLGVALMYLAAWMLWGKWGTVGALGLSFTLLGYFMKLRDER